MKPKDRILHALRNDAPDQVAAGENDVECVLAEQVRGRATRDNGRINRDYARTDCDEA